MTEQSSFAIYNASAGSGKTFALVKEYLKTLLKSNNYLPFRTVLALTFTNKAVGEMKERIIDTLQLFSDKAILKTPNSMFSAIVEELNIDKTTLHKKSKTLLQSIIHNYAAFDISTIDKFNHKLIRTFAYDLKLPLNFEVELDQDTMLNEAVDSLIAKTGTDKALTKVLVDFAIEKVDDDKSWDVAFDFNKIAKLLINENDLYFINTLKDKTLDDFKTLKSQLSKDSIEHENLIVEKAQSILTLIEECGLQFNDFSGSYIPKHFVNLTRKKFEINFEAKWQDDIENKTLYPKRVTDDIGSIINEIQPQIASAFNNTKQEVFQLKFLKAIYKNCTPLSVLNAIRNELNTLKEDQNKMLISEFNTIINTEIKDQPTPFIYERLGEKFKHYFIDEFQDTSKLQWENLVPLISNSLEQEQHEETGSLMLVGDAKQAIYRWRGGEAEQFIDLYNQKANPFHVQPKINHLESNYRSFQEIIKFNNSFFEFLSKTIFNNEDYSKLYASAKQNHFLEKEGYVNLCFLDIDDNIDEMYTHKVYETIQNCLKNGFSLSDICVLVRKKKEGLAISEYLNEQNIKIISSETMLLQNSKKVLFIDNLLKLLLQPKNNEIKIKVLNYIATTYNINDKHHFFKTYLAFNIKELFKNLEAYQIYINPNHLVQLPLYDLVETIIRNFKLVSTSDAYIQFYLDVILEYSQKQLASLSGFVNYFENKKNNLSIVSPEGQDAIQIMTIHKSKGLEFPIVIFPYADLDIYREKEPKVWFPLDKNKFNNFSHTLINYNKDVSGFGDIGEQIYNKHQAQLELDNINLLYVALTRPIEQLYIISKKDITKGQPNAKTYSGFLINYLQNETLWIDTQFEYSFGQQKKTSEEKEVKQFTQTQTEFISTSKQELNITFVTNSGNLWDTLQEEAIEKGNLIHNIMSQIKTKDDVPFVIEEYLTSGKIDVTQSKVLKELINDILNHKQLQPYFSIENTIYNEQDIITKAGNILRPDRLVITPLNEAIIIDYKTGFENPKHMQQLQMYQDVLEDMNFNVTKKILIYINDGIIVKEL